ncbi:MAG TPA: hypothetical protein VGM70_03405 [Pseudolysinimonas sp.]|jgi:hypothetical protein
MAEFDELDELLSGSLKRAAQPGDSAGVADAIRARVAAGDVGTPAPSQGMAPGFGPGAGGWLPWLGLIVVGAIVGGVLGVTGVAGHPIQHETSANQGILIALSVPGRACPGGPIVAELVPGSRVVALARSTDGSSVQVRNPSDTRTDVWIPASKMESDSGQPAFSTLPVGDACPTIEVPLPAPVVEAPVAPPAPGKPSKPGTPSTPSAPAPDTTPPTVATPVVATNQNCLVVVTVTATDDVGVTGVTVVLSGANGGSHPMTFGNGHWQYTLQAPPVFSSGSTTFTVTAKDAAGHSSSPKSVSASVQCLI